jgi:hypothetical protein
MTLPSLINSMHIEGTYSAIGPFGNASDLSKISSTIPNHWQLLRTQKIVPKYVGSNCRVCMFWRYDTPRQRVCNCDDCEGVPMPYLKD